MNIIDAARKGGKITGSEVEKRGDEYWYAGEKSGAILAPDVITPITMTKERLLADDYEPYEPQIVPKEAGELWYNNNDDEDKYYHTEDHTDSLCGLIMSGYGKKGFKEADNGRIIHGQNGWTRLFPEVPDPNIERVEITGESRDGIESKLVTKTGALIHDWKSKGKLIFEWNKE